MLKLILNWPKSRWEDLWGGDEPSLRGRGQPMARISLEDARGFARWRFCRLPRLDEWVHAATDGGRYPYPWGNPERSTWANTVDRSARTRPARSKSPSSIEYHLDRLGPEFGDASEAQRLAAAEAAKRAYFAELAMKSAVARRREVPDDAV